MQKKLEVDVAIIGGGIAGLWLLNRLRQLGFAAILLESHALGSGQTHLAQGIIHGGMKYALQGLLTPAAVSVSDMPSIWKACWMHSGEIDLSRVPILSEQQYLWSNGGMSAHLAGQFARLMLNSAVTRLGRKDYPAVFQVPQFKGQVYALNEMVLDVHALVRELARPCSDHILQIAPMKEEDLSISPSHQLSLCIHSPKGEMVAVQAKRYVFTAGNGNAMIVKKINDPAHVAMQQRPLHMVIMQQNHLPALYAHCLGMSATPRITVTTHTAASGKTVWYLGGQIAEEGVHLGREEQIQKTKKELQEVLPWCDFATAEFSSFYINRAESLQADGSRPNSCDFKRIGNMMVAWPTKLAFAPRLAHDIISALNEAQIQPSGRMAAPLDWPTPAVAMPVWDSEHVEKNSFGQHGN